MRYMLILNTPRDGYQQYLEWPRKILEANIAFMQRFTQKLQQSGELVSAEGLDSPERAKLVRAGKDGMPVTDGVFPESKEFLAGYWIVEVDTPERAYAIAAEASTAPGAPVRGADGRPVEQFWVEVRQIMQGPPEP